MPDLPRVSERTVDEAIADVAHRRRMARLLADECAVIVLSRQLDRLLDLKLAARKPPMIHR